MSYGDQSLTPGCGYSSQKKHIAEIGNNQILLKRDAGSDER